MQRQLPPEACLDLQIHLDLLRAAEERCRAALRRMAEGELTRGEYLSVLERQTAAQRAWHSRHQRYFKT